MQLSCLHDLYYNFLNTNDSVDRFIKYFVTIVNKSFPFKTKKRSNSTEVRWFNTEIKSMRRRLNQAKKKLNVTNSDTDWMTYNVV